MACGESLVAIHKIKGERKVAPIFEYRKNLKEIGMTIDGYDDLTTVRSTVRLQQRPENSVP